jgi:hypothetical protein
MQSTVLDNVKIVKVNLIYIYIYYDTGEPGIAQSV